MFRLPIEFSVHLKSYVKAYVVWLIGILRWNELIHFLAENFMYRNMFDILWMLVDGGEPEQTSLSAGVIC